MGLIKWIKRKAAVGYVADAIEEGGMWRWLRKYPVLVSVLFLGITAIFNALGHVEFAKVLDGVGHAIQLYELPADQADAVRSLVDSIAGLLASGGVVYKLIRDKRAEEKIPAAGDRRS